MPEASGDWSSGTFDIDMTDRRDEILRHFPALLNRWRGVDARLWTLSSAHPILLIVLCDHQRPGSLEIACIAPERIEAPHRWTNSNLNIQNDGDLFRVIDEGARVLISRCGVEIKEFSNKPWER